VRIIAVMPTAATASSTSVRLDSVPGAVPAQATATRGIVMVKPSIESLE